MTIDVMTPDSADAQHQIGKMMRSKMSTAHQETELRQKWSGRVLEFFLLLLYPALVVSITTKTNCLSLRPSRRTNIVPPFGSAI